MNLFEEKHCDICGENIGILNKQKPDTINLCEKCENKLSPLFSKRHTSTLDEIRAHLTYREENAQALTSFHTSYVSGEKEKIYIDLNAKKLIVSSSSDFTKENPDIIDAEQIILCERHIEDDEEEVFFTDKDGNEKSYDPPQYRHAYKFIITFKIDSPWFDEITVDLNKGRRPKSINDDLYLDCQMNMSELYAYIQQMTHKPSYLDVICGPIPGYIEHLRAQQKPVGMQQQPVQKPTNQPLPKGSWECFCGTANFCNFCSECGRPRT